MWDPHSWVPLEFLTIGAVYTQPPAICQLEFRFFHPQQWFPWQLIVTNFFSRKPWFPTINCLSLQYWQQTCVWCLLLNLSQVCGLAFMCFLQDGHLVVCSILLRSLGDLGPRWVLQLINSIKHCFPTSPNKVCLHTWNTLWCIIWVLLMVGKIITPVQTRSCPTQNL